jgi:pilus assembly protein CpaB
MVARRLILALCVALVISGAFTYWLSRRFSKGHTSTQLRYITTAKPLDAGEILIATDLKQMTWQGAALEGTFTRTEDVVGRTLLYPVASGQPILDKQISAVGAGTGLSTRIPPGMRALSLKSDQVVGVAGYLLPGTHVDVLVTFHAENTQDPMTSTVLQDVQILTAGQKMQPDPDGKATSVDFVTLLVTPSDAEKVVLASAQGRVHFVLRNGADHVMNDEPPTQLADLGAKAPPKLAPVVVRRVSAPRAIQVPQPYQIEMIRGDKRTMESVQ